VPGIEQGHAADGNKRYPGKNCDLPKPLLDKILARFSQFLSGLELAHMGISFGSRPRKSRMKLWSLETQFPDCTKSCQAPVDGLHSIENKLDKDATFSLTSVMGGVKTHSFFDKFSRFN
jgi:hypothetical protein